MVKMIHWCRLKIIPSSHERQREFYFVGWGHDLLFRYLQLSHCTVISSRIFLSPGPSWRWRRERSLSAWQHSCHLHRADRANILHLQQHQIIMHCSHCHDPTQDVEWVSSVWRESFTSWSRWAILEGLKYLTRVVKSLYDQNSWCFLTASSPSSKGGFCLIYSYGSCKNDSVPWSIGVRPRHIWECTNNLCCNSQFCFL